MFLAKAATLTKPEGRVSMIQPASSLLFNRSGPAKGFRERLFSEFKVEEVVNLSTLRFELFENATSPPCIVTLRPTKPDNEPLLYISPKQVMIAGGAEVAESQYAIVIEPHDISRIWPEEAATEPLVWTSLAWGGRRDLAFVRALGRHSTLEKLRKAGLIQSREGVIRGDRKQIQQEIVGRRFLEEDDFPPDTFLYLNAEQMRPNDDPRTHSKDSTSYEAFQTPQLLIKQGWTTRSGRFQAVMIAHHDDGLGVICSQSYISAHAAAKSTLESATLSYNSVLAVYFLLLTSGRLASYRPEPLVEEMRGVPFASPRDNMLAGIRSLRRRR